MTSATETPIPNRLAVVPQHLKNNVDKVLDDGQGMERKRLKKCINIAYCEGYMDGYRDGHTDAENGHDERVRATVS